mmetsp:Transcript_17962/g.48316  ORF Transcript_17962/g.48316 Transcript_17962/m.48316 type:complete len:219 (-) Transcript_17962:81-737(-)
MELTHANPHCHHGPRELTELVAVVPLLEGEHSEDEHCGVAEQGNELVVVDHKCKDSHPVLAPVQPLAQRCGHGVGQGVAVAEENRDGEPEPLDGAEHGHLRGLLGTVPHHCDLLENHDLNEKDKSAHGDVAYVEHPEGRHHHGDRRECANDHLALLLLPLGPHNRPIDAVCAKGRALVRTRVRIVCIRVTYLRLEGVLARQRLPQLFVGFWGRGMSTL